LTLEQPIKIQMDYCIIDLSGISHGQ